MKEINNEKRLDLYKTMKKIRLFEMTAIELYKNGEMPGFLHPTVGQEATDAGTVLALEKNDLILTNHRGHGHVVAKGVELKKIMAELYAKETGCCKGRGGSMHIMSTKDGIMGANGIVGAGIAIAPGCGLASKMKGTGQVTMCFFGDGASNTGNFHEGINLAAIWKLPVVFVCENNFYAESTLQSYATNVEFLSERAKAYGIPGVSVDGNDVEQVFLAALEAIQRAREGQGPTLLECRTYKWFGHYIGDPALYRTEEEVNSWKQKDPIITYERILLEKKILTSEVITEIDKALENEIKEAIDFARKSPEPDPDMAMNYIYA